MRTIKDMPEHSRPREKLRERGASALTDQELVAAILGMGTAGVSGGEPEAGEDFQGKDIGQAGGGVGRRKRGLPTAPIMDTIVPKMSTNDLKHTIATVLFGKAQRALLAMFFLQPEQSFYLRQIVRLAGIGQGATQRELARWVDAGLLLRERRGNQVHYRVNTASPVFSELKALTVKTAGVADVLRDALAGLAHRIAVAFIHGSVARGEEKADSDVDVLVVGDVPFSEVVAALGGAQERLGRELNPSVFPPQEFRRKLQAGHHFLTSVMTTPKLFLIGSERELKRLGE